MMLLAIAAAVLSLPAFAQDAPKKDTPPKPAVSPSQALLDTWNDVGRKLIAMAEDFPEDGGVTPIKRKVPGIQKEHRVSA